MKKRMKKILCLCLAMIFVALPLCACGGVDTGAAVSYEKLKVSRAIFQYLCCLEKTSYLYEAYGVDPSQVSTSQLEDNPMIWTAVDATGTSVSDSLKTDVLEEVQRLLYFKKYAQDQGFVLSDESKKSIKESFNQMISQFEDKKAFNKEMKKYGIDYDEMFEFYQMQSLASKGEDLLFGENGKMKVSEETAKQYFNDKYVTIGCIFINTKNKTFPNGKVVALPADEKAAKEKQADSVMSRVLAGEDFDTLCVENSDQDIITLEKAKEGYTFTDGGFVNSDVEKKAFEMKNGDIARVDTDGGVYILQRRVLNSSYFESESEIIISQIAELKKYSLVNAEAENFKMDEDFLNGLDIVALPHVV